MLYDRIRLKQNAKAAMSQANPKTWLVTLVFILLTGAVSSTLNALAPSPMGEYVGTLVTDMLENGGYGLTPGELLLGGVGTLGASAGIGVLGLTMFFSLAATAVSVVLGVVMRYGYRRYALEVSRREPYTGVGSIFKGFPRFGAAVGSAFLVGLFSMLWGLLIYGVDALITVLVLIFTDGSRVGTWIGLGALFLLAALIHTLVTYRYCLVPYFVMDDEKLPVFQAITASVQAMKGNAWKRFVLGLSFLGWELLRGLIASLMAMLASMAALLAAGGSLGIFLGLNEWSKWTMTGDTKFVTAMLILLAAVFIVFALAALAQLPLKLWLTSYRNVAYAGFYQMAAGKTAEEPVPAAVAPLTGSDYFDNTQPAVPATPFTPPAAEEAPAPAASVETSPAAPATAPYTPFGSGDAAPAPGETAPVAEPETPASPAEPEN